MSLNRYIHNNPLHHGFTEQPEAWRYSSYLAFLSSAPSRVRRSEVLALFGSIASLKAFHQLQNNQDIDYCLIDV